MVVDKQENGFCNEIVMCLILSGGEYTINFARVEVLITLMQKASY